MTTSPDFSDAFAIRLAGSMPAYDVYDVVLYPQLVSDRAAQEAYKMLVRTNVSHARAAGRKAWAAVDLSHLQLNQMISLVYRIVLPFVRTPMIAKVYGSGPVRETELDDNMSMVAHVLRSAFRYALVDDRAAALPPGFVPPAE